MHIHVNQIQTWRSRHAGGKVSVEVFKEDKQSLGGLAAQIHLARRLGDVFLLLEP